MRVYQADVLVDGSGGEPQRDVEIIVEKGVIQEVLPSGIRSTSEDVPVYVNPGKTVLPGFIDAHVHLMFGEQERTYKDVWSQDSDGLMVIRGVRNAYRHLRAGVTTLRDAGAVHNVGFDLRDGARAGYFAAPRILACGRPLTITGGHFWWCGQEADGEVGVRAAVRQLIKDGADFLKIMASGGGTLGTDSRRPSFSVEELRAAVEEIHQFGKRAVAHCVAAEGLARAAEAGVDELEHYNFLRPDGSRVWDQAVAEKILEKGLFVNPTVQTGWAFRQRMETKKAEGTLTLEEQRQLEATIHKHETKLEFTRRFHEMGIPISYGTDSIRTFGDYASGLQMLHRWAGLSAMEIIRTATSVTAKSVGMEHKVGTIQPGMLADLVYVDGDPLSDVTVLGRVEAVVLNGELVVEKRLQENADIPGLEDAVVGVIPFPLHTM
jgi:imidazolonepropionase-like amidohydrolase